MSTDFLGYGEILTTAMCSVLREALLIAQKKNFPGEHHFYISFQTTYPGVIMPDYLLREYPHEMTIILQYQFWNLVVGTTALEVELSFDCHLEKLTIPYAAVLSFFDPSVDFGLQIRALSAVGDSFSQEKENITSIIDEPAIAKDSVIYKEKNKAEKDNNPSDLDKKVIVLEHFRKKK